MRNWFWHIYISRWPPALGPLTFAFVGQLALAYFGLVVLGKTDLEGISASIVIEGVYDWADTQFAVQGTWRDRGGRPVGGDSGSPVYHDCSDC